jgi:hypothetical protein
MILLARLICLAENVDDFILPQQTSHSSSSRQPILFARESRLQIATAQDRCWWASGRLSGNKCNWR